MKTNQYLRLSSIAGAFLVGFWLPVRLIGFISSPQLEILFDVVLSAVSLINIYLHFLDNKKDPKVLKSWLHASLLMDFFCFIPFSFFGLVLFGKTFNWILAFNLVTVRHVRKIKNFLDGMDSLQPLTYRLVPLVISLPLLVHLIACGWIALGSGTAGIDDDLFVTYAKAIYWSFTTLTTVGYGDITAKTVPQMFFTCGIEVMGVGVFGYILSNVAGLLARSDAAREHHMDNLDKIETFMKLHAIPPDLKTKIRAYYHYLWQNKKGYQDHALLENLPHKIQSELFLNINKSIVEKVPFLKGATQDLIEDLMNQLEPRIFVPGERIFRIDEDGDALYLIHKGSVEILTRTNDVIVSLGEGSFFGEMALVSDKPRSATARASSFCDVYVLQKAAFDKVTHAYPEFKHHMETIVLARKAS